MGASTLFSVLLVCLMASVSAGIFSFNAQPPDMDIFIRESKNSQCRWYNSGIFGLIPRSVNSTTFCRCRDVNLYECKTFVVRNSTSTPTTTSMKTTATTASNQTTAAPVSTTAKP